MEEPQFLLRPWQPQDRSAVAELIADTLAEYGLGWEPTGADRDVMEVEEYYLRTGGAFWVMEVQGRIVGSGGYYPCSRGVGAVELRKMYLRPGVRRRGLGKMLLQALEQEITRRGWREIWLETASVLKEAVIFYESQGYAPSTGVETARCDRVYVKYLA